MNNVFLDREFIVFGQEHYNPLGIIRSLGEKKIKPVAIIIKNTYRITSKSRYIKKLYFVDNVDEGIQLIKSNYYNKENPGFLFTADDSITIEVNNHYQDLKDGIIFFNAGEEGALSKYINKKNIGDLAINCGLNFLKSWSVNRGDVPEDIVYPILTKAIDPTVGNWKADSFVCYSKKDLLEAYEKIKSNKVLLQKYIEKKNEIAFEGFSVNK